MIIRIFNTIFIAFILTISIVVIFSGLGWVRLLVVKTGSMTPTLPVNSLLVIVPTRSVFNQTKLTSYKAGDIVSFKPAGEKTLITHRIVDVSTQNKSTVYQTKGDANLSKDQWKITGSNILGKVAISFAGVGIAVSFLNSFLGLFLLVIIPAAFIILHEVLTIQEEIKKAKEEKDLNISKKALAGPVIVIMILLLATPVYAIFSSSAFLTGNSLSTRGSFLADHIVINEVYYQVDNQHGRDASGGICSTNNSTTINNSVDAGSNTGGNSASGNTGGNTSIQTGTSSATININNTVNSGTNCARSDEWVELYNPTDSDVNLKNWTLQDNTTKVVKITGNKILKTHQFALLSKSTSTWNFWNPNPSALKISLGTVIGNGLDNSGDRLTLKNSSGQTVDRLSYGADTSIFNPSIPLVSLGNSFERNPKGFDSDLETDFISKNPPTPGS